MVNIFFYQGKGDGNFLNQIYYYQDRRDNYCQDHQNSRKQAGHCFTVTGFLENKMIGFQEKYI